MNLKISLLSTIAIIGGMSAIAQDKIYKKDGAVLNVKVLEVGPKTISYKNSANSDGPNYVVNKNEVDRIEYQEGNEDSFDEDRSWLPPHPLMGRPRLPRIDNRNSSDYGNNILSISPLQLTDNGAGIAISYERVLDKKNNIVSFYFPVAIAFDNNNSRSGNGDFNTYYIMPGLKFYPTGGKGVIKYGIGTNLVFLSNKETIARYEMIAPGQSMTVYEDKNNFLFGMIINNSLNINPTSHLHMGLEFGLGFSYTDRENTYNDPYYYNNNNGPAAFLQLGFKIGYRF